MITSDDNYKNLLFAIIYQAILDMNYRGKRKEYIVAREEAPIFLFDKTASNHKFFKDLCRLLGFDYEITMLKIKFVIKQKKIIDQKNISSKQIFHYFKYMPLEDNHLQQN